MTTDHPPIMLVCFDMAGTTVKDDGAVETAFLSALASVGVSEDDERFPKMMEYVVETMGMSKIDVFRALFSGDDALPDKANAVFETAYGEQVAKGNISPMPGAEEMIAGLRNDGIKVALMTGFSIVTRDDLVRALGWEKIADLYLCPQEAGRGRPYPDMVLTAVLRCAIDDVAAVAVVGDTASDVTTGLRSGASIVAGVLTGADDRDRLQNAGATHVVDSVCDIPSLLQQRK